jgi:hypothetical protein
VEAADARDKGVSAAWEIQRVARKQDLIQMSTVNHEFHLQQAAAMVNMVYIGTWAVNTPQEIGDYTWNDCKKKFGARGILPAWSTTRRPFGNLAYRTP